MGKEALKLGKIKHHHITMRKDICGGNPIIKGTRTSVANIAGITRDEQKYQNQRLKSGPG